MKTAIYVPDDVFVTAERMAKRMSVSRSELYARAVREYIAEHRHAGVRERLDALYVSRPSNLDQGLLDAQILSLPPEDW
ncbi:MAG: ribbon-helix-helix domain-containing protein [Candidatus Aureabacteria bacterium]|nr:ribbon-helix-helix domain-containing protein [Candidatus Auribacterota bacterium]